MVKVQEAYLWEAEKKDGTIVTKGASLEDCVRFSLLPQIDLPQHDIVGVPMIRRFARAFQSVKIGEFNDIPEGGLGWCNGSNIVATFTDLRELIKPGFLIRQWGPENQCPWCTVVEVNDNHIVIGETYPGRTAVKCRSRFSVPALPVEYLHCVVCKGFRLYVKSSTGAALVTPEDYEVYL